MGTISKISIEGLSQFSQALEDRMRTFKGKKTTVVWVGYSAEYAVYVHEIPKNYRNGKTTKYLETPARTERQAMVDIILQDIRPGPGQRSMKQAMTRAANHLKKASQKLVPYDTGFLHDSAFVHVQD